MKRKIKQLILFIVILPFFFSGCQARQPSEEQEQQFKAGIALVIDDWGYSKKLFDEAAALNVPVTFSVLPNLDYSSHIALRAHQSGYEVILHLPMEPHNLITPEEAYLNPQMSKEEITLFLEKSLKSVPSAKGISNHQGSKATEDRQLMESFFEIVRGKDLFFLDNIVTDNSCAKEIASAKGIEVLKRTVFLDNKSDFKYIEGQFNELQQKALANGAAIGVCHARKTTIEALKLLVAEAKEKGIRFIFLSELLN